MFTGIVEELGKILHVKKSQDSSSLSIEADVIFDDLKLGDSVAVNGVCLTASSIEKNIFTADVMNETFNRSSLGELNSGSLVNLERAMPLNGRFGGHIVSGHIDGVGIITSIKKDSNATWYTIQTTDKLMRYIIEKGSITIDGISLTVAKVSNNNFQVSIIPHTSKVTILSQKSIGSTVNLENDIIGKYIEKFLSSDTKKPNDSKITMEFLTKSGF